MRLWAVLLAGSAAALFAVALAAFLGFDDRLAGVAAFGGFLALSLSVLLHVNELPPTH